MDDRLSGAVYPFEDIGDDLALPPLAARRALDRAGLRLSVDAYQGLSRGARENLARAGAEEKVDPEDVERVARTASPPATRIKPVPDPDPLSPPEQLNHALGPRRAVTPAQWAKLRALDRYALVHVMRRSIAHNDPGRLEAAADAILRHRQAADPRTQPPPREPARREAHDRESRTRERDRERDRDRDYDLPPVLDFGAARPRSDAPPRHDPVSSGGRSVDPRSEPPQAIGLDAPFERSPSSRAPGASVSTHLSRSGEVHMVDVGDKPITHRRATATGVVTLTRETAARLARHDTPKGEVLATARIAGVMAAKRTSELIPLCHNIALTKVEVLIDVEVAAGIVTVSAAVEAHDRTGVEMEALTAVSVACLTIYDMLKGIDRTMTIGDVRLVSKSGGRSGDFVR